MKVLRIDPSGTLREVNVAGSLGSINFTKERFTLTPVDVSNGFVALASTPIANSLTVMVGVTTRVEIRDYTVSTVMGVSRLNFAGPLGAAGVSALEANDEVSVEYAIEPITELTEFVKYSHTLTAADISNQYIDLPDLIQELSLDMIVDCLLMSEDLHYQIEQLPTFTRIHLIGPLASAGVSALVEGEEVFFQYAISS